jgi:hypothetical protein
MFYNKIIVVSFAPIYTTISDYKNSDRVKKADFLSF